VSERPVLKIRLADPKTGSVRFRLPKKGGRWQGPVPRMDDAVQKAVKEGVETPFSIQFCESED
jgi:hypothetical protein